MTDTQQTASDTFDPYASIRQRVLSQMSADPSLGTTPDSAPMTASPDFQAANNYGATPAPVSANNYGAAPVQTVSPNSYGATPFTNDTPQPAGGGNDGTPSPPATSQPAALASPVANPYDPTNPANQGSGGTFNTPAPGNDANQISGWYSGYLGRPPTNEDLTYWLNTGQSLSQIQNAIANSPEAMAYAKSQGFGQPNAAPNGAGATPAPVSSGGGTGTTAVTAPPTSAFTDQLRQILMERLKSAQAPVDENSPEIQAALQAARDEATRTSDAERTALAERLYAQGAGSGGGGPLQSNALTQGIQQSSERTAGALAQVRASLLMNAYNQKFTELQNDLQLAFASGDAESARAIQIQIANLQATVQREGIGAGLAINAANQNNTTVQTGANG